MKSICLCFQLHHPFHFQTYRFLDIGSMKSYYDDLRIKREIDSAATNFYLPSNEFLFRLINKHKGQLKLAFYISGTAIDQFLMYQPEVLASFRRLADTGQVEFLGSTSSHSLITLTNHKAELIHQITDYQSKITYHFGMKPSVFVNSDLLYSDLIGKDIYESGYGAMITNGLGKTLNWRSPNYVYSNGQNPKMHVYFRNEPISNELSINLNQLEHDEIDAHSSRFVSLLNKLDKDEPLLNIYLCYKSLGGFARGKKQLLFQELVSQIIKREEWDFTFPSEIADRCGSVAEINAGEPICWVPNFHPNYYPGNELQVEAIKQLYVLNEMVSGIDNLNLLMDWQYLQTSDHIHLMDDQHPSYQGDLSGCTYKSKYDAFINFMNILDDFRLKLNKELKKKEKLLAHRQEQNTKRKQPIPAPTASNLFSRT